MSYGFTFERAMETLYDALSELAVRPYLAIIEDELTVYPSGVKVCLEEDGDMLLAVPYYMRTGSWELATNHITVIRPCDCSGEERKMFQEFAVNIGSLVAWVHMKKRYPLIYRAERHEPEPAQGD